MSPPRPVRKGRVKHCDCGELAVYQVGNAKICAGCYQKDHSENRRDKTKQCGEGREQHIYSVRIAFDDMA